MENFEPATGIKAFDAFPKVEKSFRAERTTRGAILSIFLGISLFYLFVSEFTWYLGGYETHQFVVDKDIKDHLSINVDMTISMPCSEVEVHVQDVTGDIIMAGETLKKQSVGWSERGSHHLDAAHQAEDVYDLQQVLRSKKKKFKKGRESINGKACRVYGSMEVHHAAGDFHITAAGVGYYANHQTFLEDMDFTHRIDELSFGDYYPNLINPLDGTHADSVNHFHRFQYFLNVVPTTYQSGRRKISTNQYAVTESSRYTDQNAAQFFPGIFFKYEIEPVTLIIKDARMPFLQFLIKLLGITAGIVTSTNIAHKLMNTVYGKMRNSPRRGGSSLLDQRRKY